MSCCLCTRTPSEESPNRQRKGLCEHTVAPRAGLSPTMVISADLRTCALSHTHPTPSGLLSLCPYLPAALWDSFG